MVSKCLHAVASLAFFFLGSSLPYSTCFMNQTPPQRILPHQTLTPDRRTERESAGPLPGTNRRPGPNGASHESGILS